MKGKPVSIHPTCAKCGHIHYGACYPTNPYAFPGIAGVRVDADEVLRLRQEGVSRAKVASRFDITRGRVDAILAKLAVERLKPKRDCYAEQT